MVLKVSSIVLLTTLACSAQVTSRCSFLTQFPANDYTCRLDNMFVTNENDFVNLNGTHKVDRTDADVTAISFFHGRMEVAFPEMVLERFPNIHTVFVTGNIQMRRFAIPRCQQLRIFSFEGPANPIITLFDGMFRNCINLVEFRMQRTSVVTLEERLFDDTPNLRRLWMPRNQFLSLSPRLFNGLTHLEHLDIERNSIFTFDPMIFQGLRNLQHIQCGQLNNRNWPSGLFSNLPNLAEVNINWSGLQTIEPAVFSNLPSLQIIRIYGEVRRLSANIFAGPLPRVHTLNIGTNLVDAIERGFFNNLPALRNLYAGRNICVSTNFLDIVNMQPVLQALETCFANF